MRPIAPHRKFALCLLLGAAGFLGNWFKIELFFNVDFLFGSFFVMLAIARCGVAGGVMAGLLAGSCSYFLWNHPWAIVIFTCEALFVAILNRRWPGNLVVLDAVYWLCLGMPLVWVFYHLDMGVGNQVAALIALKMSVNGIFNAMLATACIYALLLVRSGGDGYDKRISFRQLIFVGMVSVSLIPVFIYLLVDLREMKANIEEEERKRVLSVAETAQDLLNVWIGGNRQTILALSQLVGDPNKTPFAEMQKSVETLKKSNPYLLRLGVFNSDSVTVAFAPLIDNRGKSCLGLDYSDRSCVANLRKTLRPAVGDVAMGRIGAPAPSLPLLAPIIVNGHYRGACGGVVNFERLTEQLRILVKGRYSEITIIDDKGKVVASSSGKRLPMQAFSRPTGGETRNLENGIYQWIPKMERNTPALQRWRGSLLVKEVRLNDETPWTIVVEGSLQPHLDMLWELSINDFLLLWGVIILTFVASHFLSKRFVSSLQKLATISTDLPSAIQSKTEVTWPETKIGELFTVVDNFREMAAALGLYIHRLEEAKEQLEKRVAERTMELRKSEERYSRIVTTANEGIWVVDGDLVLSFANRQFLEMIGYRQDEVIGRRMDEFMPAEELKAHAERVKARREGKAEQYERVMRRKDGSLITVQFSATPIFEDDQGFNGSFGMCTDITDSKRIKNEMQNLNLELEQRALERKAELWRLNRELESFCYSISHELRAPIARLVGFSALLSETRGKPQEELFLAERIGVASLRLRSVIDSLLLMNRLTRAEMTHEQVDLSELARVTVRELLEEEPGKKVEIRIAPDLMVRGDRSMLAICMRNLLDNALKYTARKERAVIELDRSLTAGESVFFVRDNGAGFDLSFADKLFEPFCRLHSEDEFEGVGVGLPTVQRIIERHGGRIWAEAEEGRGATFYFSLAD